MTIADDQVRHHTYIRRYSASTVKRMIALLSDADADLNAMLLTAELGTKRRMEETLAAIRVLNRDLWDQFHDSLESDLLAFGAYEAGWQAKLLSKEATGISTVSADQVKALVTSRPFQGKYLREWAKSLSDAQFQRVRDAVRIGVVNGYTNEQIARNITGTRSRRFKDGKVAIGKRQAEAVVRTAVTHVSSAADNEVYKRNSDVVQKVQYSAILDGRTTLICMSLDGKVYDIYKGPRPPQHVGCRSIIIPLTGGVEAFTDSYEDWLRRQSAEEQVEILGFRKAKLFRDGKLSLDRFVDRRGNELTLDELEAREIDSWQRAFG